MKTEITKRTWLIIFGIFLTIILIASACSPTVPDHPLYHPYTGTYKATGYQSFQAYQKATKEWVTKARIFLSKNHAHERAVNLPYTKYPANMAPPKKGVLFVHGLGDSPYSFTDLANEFVKQGYIARTILLPGHGTRPADMLHVTDEQWDAVLREQIAIMKKEVDELSLAGFSTGANLVTSYAIDDPGIKSLYLFSPAYRSKVDFDYLVPALAFFKDWIILPKPALQDNIARYRTVPLNGFAQYYYTSRDARTKITTKGFDRPAFMVLSEHDSVVNTKAVLKLFEKHFTHPQSRLLWIGSKIETTDKRIDQVTNDLPDLRISNFSHMSVLFAPENSYYGKKGSYRLCNNSPNQQDYDSCKKGAPVWYSAWGTQKKGIIHARLTYNPYFNRMLRHMRNIIAP